MKAIHVKLGASQDNESITVELDDLGVTQIEWDSYNKQERHEVLKEFVFDMNSQPYWMIDNFREVD